MGKLACLRGLDPSEYQIADVEVALLDIFVVKITKLLLIPGMLEGSVRRCSSAKSRLVCRVVSASLWS